VERLGIRWGERQGGLVFALKRHSTGFSGNCINCGLAYQLFNPKFVECYLLLPEIPVQQKVLIPCARPVQKASVILIILQCQQLSRGLTVSTVKEHRGIQASIHYGSSDLRHWLVDLDNAVQYHRIDLQPGVVLVYVHVVSQDML
jgi:hypothetical protein